MPRLLLVDALNHVFRSYHAMAKNPLRSPSGMNTNAPYGMLRYVRHVLEMWKPTHAGVIFDAGDSGRREMHPGYKANRPPMPEDLRDSLPAVERIVAGLGVAIVRQPGLEADDLIGAYARAAAAAGFEVAIASSDKDLCQLVGPGVQILAPGVTDALVWVDEAGVEKRLGVLPTQVADYLTLVGDTSDNVPGAPGIGPKGAVKLLQTHGSLDAAIEAARSGADGRPYQILRDNPDAIALARALVTLKEDVTLPFSVEALAWKGFQRDRLIDACREYGFRTMLRDFESMRYAAPGAPAAAPAAPTPPAAPSAAEIKKKAAAEQITLF